MDSKDISLGQPVLCRRLTGRVVTAVVFGVNPANDGGPEDEVRLQFTDGRDEWVRLDAVGPMPQTLHPGWLRVGQDLADYDQLKNTARKLVELIDNPPIGSLDRPYMQDLAQPTWDAVYELRNLLGMPNPLD